MEGYKKSSKLSLNVITNDSVIDIDPVMENFTKLESKVYDIKVEMDKASEMLEEMNKNL